MPSRKQARKIVARSSNQGQPKKASGHDAKIEQIVEDLFPLPSPEEFREIQIARYFNTIVLAARKMHELATNGSKVAMEKMRLKANELVELTCWLSDIPLSPHLPEGKAPTTAELKAIYNLSCEPF